MTAPGAVAVVVPARDEEELLPACLDSLAEAVQVLARARPGTAAQVFVVLDRCRDRSAAAVADRPGVRACVSDEGNVGAARGLGVRAAAAWGATTTTGPLWIASTDADSAVPPHWLVAQVDLAVAGRELVVGTVEPRSGDLDPATLARWRERHSSADGHDHVHGANLGFSLDAYRAVGGFAPLALHEDVDLVGRMRRAGVDRVATGSIAVTTSGRRTARAAGGFAAYLEDLGA